MLKDNPTKKCCKCGRTSCPEIPFEKNSRGTLSPWCKECYRIHDLKRRHKREQRREQSSQAQPTGVNPFEWRTYKQPVQIPIQTENEIYNYYQPLPVIRE